MLCCSSPQAVLLLHTNVKRYTQQPQEDMPHGHVPAAGGTERPGCRKSAMSAAQLGQLIANPKATVSDCLDRVCNCPMCVLINAIALLCTSQAG